MATKAARPAYYAGGRRYRLGNKKVHLPDHVITLAPPSRNQPPTLATFHVPLRFNKLDMRDYLYNVYNLETLSVRSFINPINATRRIPGNDNGIGFWRQPANRKFMTVEMERPFYYPKKPTDLLPWDQDLHERLLAIKKKSEGDQVRDNKGRPPIVGRRKDDDYAMAKEAAKVKAEGWDNGVVLDEKWKRILKEEEKK